jgi:cephalosporin hydroxylase
MSALRFRHLKAYLRRKLYYDPTRERSVIDTFHRLYYDSEVWKRTAWQGVKVWKCPLDLWVYQEIVHEVRPELVIETGTASGGSALYFAHLLDWQGSGEIVTIDVREVPERPRHPRIRYLTCSSVDPDTVARMRELARGKQRVMVVLDSDHTRDHVLAELRAYSELVTIGSYLMVEDSNINGHPVRPDFGPGPMEAVEEFLAESKNFVRDAEREKFYLTFCPGGYLRRVS